MCSRAASTRGLHPPRRSRRGGVGVGVGVDDDLPTRPIEQSWDAERQRLIEACKHLYADAASGNDPIIRELHAHSAEWEEFLRDSGINPIKLVAGYQQRREDKEDVTEQTLRQRVERLMDGAKLLSCSEFGDALIAHM